MLLFLIYSTNIRTEYFKHAAYSPFFSSSKCRLFHIFGSCIIHNLNTGVLKFKRKFRRLKVKNKINEKCIMIDVAIPEGRNVVQKEVIKKIKCNSL